MWCRCILGKQFNESPLADSSYYRQSPRHTLRIFSHILENCYKFIFVDLTEVFDIRR